MRPKTIKVGSQTWTIPDGDATDIMAQIISAMENGTVAELSLIDEGDRSIIVLLSGRTVQSVVIDLADGPRPSEVSG